MTARKPPAPRVGDDSKSSPAQLAARERRKKPRDRSRYSHRMMDTRRK